jgi:hypothetical protein
LFKLRPWEEATIIDPKLPHMPLVCYAVRHGHEALLKSVIEENTVPLGEYFRSAAEWFGTKNIPYRTGETKQIVDISDILLPDVLQLTEIPDPSALFFFLVEACSKGLKPVMDHFISALSGLEEPSIARRSFLQLNCEYFMIEAAANGHVEICLSLVGHCSFQAFTL